MCKYHTNEELCNNIVIGDPTRNLPKPINYRPGYDMDYIGAYYGRNNRLTEAGKEFDALSVVKPVYIIDSAYLWDLEKIDDVKPKRYILNVGVVHIYEVKARDSMKHH
uniref:Uncharacterized protein n=1 Tax=Rhizophagus irregularis (strain DAOM 181602 / DAOM 197198 / MUCL 43194) TaxID=747089 RepID=U9UNB9_RHIID